MTEHERGRLVRTIRHGEAKIIYPPDQEKAMSKIKIQSVHSGGEYEIEILFPNVGTSFQSRHDATGNRVTIRMDQDMHEQFLNAATQWIQAEADKLDERITS